MKLSRTVTRIAAVGLVGSVLAAAALAQDWPQFRGPDRTGVSKETGILKAWPAEGPKLVWKGTNLGEGHATPSVAGGKIFGMGLRGDGAEEVVWALDEKTGKELWSTKIAAGTVLQARQGGNGSRCTPTVDGDKLYVLGVSGELACLNVADGKVVWQKSLVKDFGGEVPRWGYSESPLVDGDKVIAAPGGSKSIVAFNKKDGSVAWVSEVPGSNEAHYSSAIVANVGGQKQYIHFLSGGVVGIDAATGKHLWTYAAPANRTANCSAPIYKDGMVFAATGYQTGGGLAKLTKSGAATTAEEVYFTRNMQNHHGGMVLIGDYLYGFDDAGRSLTCIEFKTGKVMWADRSVGKGSITAVDGMLILRSERGPVALVEANPNAYVEKGRFEQPERSRAASWPYPVVANGKLYLRDQDIMLVYDLKG
jgi:outer membrane protein assembly factor BamB